MEYFKVQSEDGKSYTIYSEENGNYYRQHMLYWEKGGYCVPQTRKRITKEEYFKMKEVYDNGEKK